MKSTDTSHVCSAATEMELSESGASFGSRGYARDDAYALGLSRFPERVLNRSWLRNHSGKYSGGKREQKIMREYIIYG